MPDKMKKDLLLTFFTELMILVSGLLVYKFAASLVGKDPFSQFALCRRTISFVLPALLLGLTVGIPRYIAFAGSGNQNPDKYFLAGISVLIPSVFFFTLLLNIFKSDFAFLFFGNSGYDNLIFPISLMIVGHTLHASCYSYYRGNLLMVRANTLQILNCGIIPILVFINQTEIVRILSLTGIFLIMTSTIALILICRGLEWDKTAALFPCVKELLTYGIQRVPGDFGMAALMSLPAIITAHMAGVKAAGYVAFGTALLNMTGSLFAPFGLVFLPKASQLIAGRDMVKLREYLIRLASATILLTLGGLIVFEVFADAFIRIYLGETFTDLVMITRIVMLGSLAYTFFVSMRSFLDAYHIKAINTLNVMVSITLFLTLSWLAYILDGGYLASVGAFVAALYSLGFLTLFEILKLFRPENFHSRQKAKDN